MAFDGSSVAALFQCISRSRRPEKLWRRQKPAGTKETDDPRSQAGGIIGTHSLSPWIGSLVREF
ncbi:hypothetical protein KFK09_029051 [Dendrobium nobile]|uniref:Uncharacterized protein n=1 Tax=Dendrobium nobile TaxID=94219 RepID=A0A8T3A561_DENNO|nr:hypothetical protein KFK09_029051 [Dendrobium nobile]